MSANIHPPIRTSWFVWSLGAAFYCSGFYLRVAPAVMTDRLMADFNIGAAALGNLSAFYFYSYVAMQIPTGVLADTWGPRKLLSVGAFVAAMGTFLFAAAPTVFWACAGRLLIGASVAVAYVSVLKLTSHWFSPQRFAFVLGLVLLAGVLGAVWAGVPLRFLVNVFGWRPVMFVSSAVILAICFGIWLFVRDDPSMKGYASYARRSTEPVGPTQNMGLLAGLREVFRYRNAWLLTLAPGGIVGPIIAFSGLWGVPYLCTRYGLTQEESAAMASTMLVAWAVAGPLCGALSDVIGRRKPLYLWFYAVGIVAWFLLILVPGLHIWTLVLLVVIAGFSGGGMIPGFAFIKESVPTSLAGTVSGVCNMGVMTGAMVLQPVVGWLLDLQWDGVIDHGVRIYSVEAYQTAFVIMMAWSLVGVVLLARTTETHCRQMVP